MGYLSQKKKFERLNIVLNSLLIVVGVISVLAFFNEGNGFFAYLNTWRLQLYIVAIGLLLTALYYKFFIQAFSAFLFILINYFVIASATNILVNIESNGENKISIVYQNATKEIVPLINEAKKVQADLIGVNHKHSILLPEILLSYKIFHNDASLDKSFILTNLTPERAGKLRFSKNNVASFINVEKNGKRFVFINIDFSNIAHSEKDIVFHNLAEFVLKQDEPVIIVGDFGIPAWSKTFQNFLVKTELEVKNRVILSDGKSFINPLHSPTINVLAYKNFGLHKLIFLKKSQNPNYPLLFELNF